MITDPDGKPGLRQETAAALTLRDAIKQHMRIFAHVIRADRKAGQDVVAAYVDGLAGAIALTIRGGHGNRDEVTAATEAKLREAITRDLAQLAGILTVRQ